MRFILNIGLARAGNSNIGTGTVLREIATAGFTIDFYSIQHSDTEITVVAQCEDNNLPGRDNRIDNLSTLLGQDCIAVYFPDDKFGQLIGPRAAAWGEFNPEFFLNLDGSRLAGGMKAAA